MDGTVDEDGLFDGRKDGVVVGGDEGTSDGARLMLG